MKFLLLVAVAGLAALADSATIPGLPEIPGLSNLFPKGKRDVMGDLSSAGGLQNQDLMSLLTGLLHQFQKTMVSGGNTVAGLPGGLVSDLAAGGKIAADNIKADLGKRSILDETKKVQKRDVMMDLVNMLIGNVEGAMTGMDILG